MEDIPTSVCLTSYAGGPDEFMTTPMEELAEQVLLRCAADSCQRCFAGDVKLWHATIVIASRGPGSLAQSAGT